MSVLLLLISALVLIYLGIGGTPAATVLVIATIIGASIDEWHFLSLFLGGAALALSLMLLFPGKLRKERLSSPLLLWVRGKLPKLSDT